MARMMSTHTSGPVPPRADLRFMLRHPAHLLALGLGSGLAPWAPGTFGSLFGWLVFDLLLARWPAWQTPGVMAAGLAAGFVAGVIACRITGRALGAPDHGAMVWDEVVAMVLVLSLVPRGFEWQAAGFVVFRIFDIAKPAPIRHFERRFKNGFGVMGDDLIAAFYTLLVLAAIRRFLV